MEAIENIVKLTKAETIEEMDASMMAAHEAINDLHLEKLQELERTVSSRLGMKGAVSAMEAPAKERRPVRDNPQA